VKLLDLTLPTPAENLACDEALLDAAEAGEITDEALRFWESPTHFIVVGHANHIRKEVNDDVPVPVLRRCSGGGTVVQGPGCLNYALILRIPDSGPLAHLTGTNTFVMQRMAGALKPLLGDECTPRGTTDLALGKHKFSGNAQRRKRHWLLFHGTFLLNFDLTLIGRLLKFPSRVPDYRQGRSHLDFVRNLPVNAAAVKTAVVAAWDVDGNLPVVPHARIAQLVASHYGRPEWNAKF
jgi:lipoate-protein ligase A